MSGSASIIAAQDSRYDLDKFVMQVYVLMQENSVNMETLLAAQVDGIVAALEQRKQELISFIRREKEYKLRSLKAEVSSHTQRLQQTTAFIQFCIEALKETDPSAYLQVCLTLLKVHPHSHFKFSLTLASPFCFNPSHFVLSSQTGWSRARKKGREILYVAV